jgi:antitoxin (DNA-binding transcriptional repressor) of toxin-antitoxin stability system
MERRVTATEAVRRFSEILNFVNYRGDRYIIMRGKKAVADINPHQEGREHKTLGDLRTLIHQIPPLKDKKFADDVEKAIREQPVPPADGKWV